MHPIDNDRQLAFAADARAALKELYLVSGAAAQLGASGLQVQDMQWQAIERAVRNASAVLRVRDGSGASNGSESEAMKSLQRLSMLCDELLGRRAMGHVCPSTIWRDLARAGRDAYEQIDA